MVEKDRIRESLKGRKTDERESRSISSRLSAFLDTLAPAAVFGYSPLPDEVDITPLIAPLHMALPVCTQDEMDFYTGYTELKKGRWGIVTPLNGQIVTPDRNSVIIVPGVAFTKEGVRLGRGKGFYDRYLSRYPEAVFVAPCTEDRLLESIPGEPHDIRMDYIITSKAVLATRNHG